jgi:hypothetical protein
MRKLNIKYRVTLAGEGRGGSLYDGRAAEKAAGTMANGTRTRYWRYRIC